MQIQIERDVLLGPLAMVAGVIERRQTLPILSYLLLRAHEDGLSLVGTDLEIEVVAGARSEVESSGDVTVPARKLFDICRALPEGAVMRLTKEGGKVTVRAGKSRFSLVTLPVEDFPKTETASFETAFVIGAEDLKQALEATAFCMAQQDVRYYLNGLYVESAGEHIRAVATDGHRMAISTAKCISGPSKMASIIIPRKAVLEVLRLLSNVTDSVNIELSANHLRLGLNGFSFTSKLVDGKFPDYTKVIPSTQTKHLTLDRQGFRESLGRAAILANEKYRGVRLNIEKGSLRVTAHNPEQEEAVEEIEISYVGEPLEIGFNVNYLLEATAAVESPEIVLGLNDASSSCTLKAPGEPRSQYIIMPMRL